MTRRLRSPDARERLAVLEHEREKRQQRELGEVVETWQRSLHAWSTSVGSAEWGVATKELLRAVASTGLSIEEFARALPGMMGK